MEKKIKTQRKEIDGLINFLQDKIINDKMYTKIVGKNRKLWEVLNKSPLAKA